MFDNKDFKKFLADYTYEHTGGLYKDYVQNLEELEEIYKLWTETTHPSRWSDLIKLY